eukprot:359140-Chlamydomonas_euryale.AAC.3
MRRRFTAGRMKPMPPVTVDVTVSARKAPETAALAAPEPILPATASPVSVILPGLTSGGTSSGRPSTRSVAASYLQRRRCGI